MKYDTKMSENKGIQNIYIFNHLYLNTLNVTMPYTTHTILGSTSTTHTGRELTNLTTKYFRKHPSYIIVRK